MHTCAGGFVGAFEASACVTHLDRLFSYYSGAQRWHCLHVIMEYSRGVALAVVGLTNTLPVRSLTTVAPPTFV